MSGADVQPSQPSPPAVLLVDDTPANLIALTAVLGSLEVRLVEATTGAAALEHVQREAFAVVLLDVQMPGMDGFETARRMRELPGGRELPIVFLTAIHREDQYARQGYATGAADYITKPFDPDVLRARVRAFADLFRQREAAHRSRYELRTRERDLANRQLEAFERIATSALVTDDLGAFLHTLLDVFVGAADSADTVTILLREGDELRSCASIGLAVEPGRAAAIPLGQGFAGRIAATGEESLLTRDELLASTADPSPGERDLMALYGVPLVVAGDVIGVAYIGTRRAEGFSDLETRLFKAMATRAAWVVARQRERERRLEVERSARLEAETANRLKDEFLQIVSHELRTPLNAILGWATSARSGVVSDVDRALSIIERSARSQARLIDDILDLSRIVRGKLHLDTAPTDLALALASAVEAVRPTASARGVALEILVDPDLGVVVADADRIQQVAWNLLANAIKFSRKGGQVTLTARRGAEQIVLTVSDTGEGIASEFLPFVFEAFRQADASTTRRHGGLGLGMAIARQLVQAHGGAIRVESPGPGKGATFTVELPVEAPIHPPARLPRDRSPDGGPARARLDSLRVLVVDDDEDTRELLRGVLEVHGASVDVADSAEQALERLKAMRPDILVTDIGMPSSDGYALLRAVRALSPELGGKTPAIALTAYASAEDVQRSVDAGFEMHLAKPVDPMDLVARVARVARVASLGRPGVGRAEPRTR